MDNLDGFQKLVSTIEKSRSRFLDLVSTSMSRPKSLDINVQTKKSRSRSRNLSRSRNSSRSENFGVSRQFVSISIEKCMDFCIFSLRFLNPSRLFIIFRLKRPSQCWDFWRNLDCVSTNLKNLDASWQISTFKTPMLNIQKLKMLKTVNTDTILVRLLANASQYYLYW